MARIERETMEFDVVIIGAGPAGLSAAIRLKQLDREISVVVLEKGSEVGAHILSGAVLDPVGLDRLIPDWKERGAPLGVPVTKDHFHLLGPMGQLRIPNFLMPPLMDNHGNYIVSMGNICRWMAAQAEALEVEIFPGMACRELVYGDDGQVTGVVAGVFGLEPDGSSGPRSEPGMELHGKYIFLAEGARGSLAGEVIGRYGLQEGRAPQKFGLGMKEIWEIDPAHHEAGTVAHTVGWPLGGRAGGGSFIYHAENHQLYLGFVVHLDYKNPHLFPYMEFQRFKHHPIVADLLEGGRRIAYGARAISEGGIQSVPGMVAPGVALLGCSAGLVNVPRIKGNHNAMLSGISAAEAAYAAIRDGRQGDDLTDYETAVRTGLIGQELAAVRNVKPLWSRRGTLAALALGGFDMWCQSLGRGFSPFGTLTHEKSDAQATEPAAAHRPIAYRKPDGRLSFDRLTNLRFSATNHRENQPGHLRLGDPGRSVAHTLPEYDEPAQRYCPAGVFEVVEQEGKAQFVVNFQNCVHCKTCDIKDPAQNITWTPPEGGDGPNYPNM